jgi:hypothetical protein
MSDQKYLYRVHVPWTDQSNRWWDEVCIWAIETYGLPGDQYVTELSAEYMNFDFKDRNDAFIMSLTWGLVQ